eukprot:g4700.t1
MQRSRFLQASNAAAAGEVSVVAAGAAHSLICSRGALASFGWGRHGQLGHGASESDAELPRPVLGAYVMTGTVRIVCVAAGLAHSAAVDDFGRLFTFGLGTHGELGLGDRRGRRSLELVPPTCFRGSPGRLGLPPPSSTSSSSDNKGDEPRSRGGGGGDGGDGGKRGKQAAAAAAAAVGTSNATTKTKFRAQGDGPDDGEGSDNDSDGASQEGDGAGDGFLGFMGAETVVPRRVDHTAAAEDRGQHDDDALGADLSFFKEERPALNAGPVIVAVACGDSHTAAIDEHGALYTCGRGDDGRLGHGCTDGQTRFACVATFARGGYGVRPPSTASTADVAGPKRVIAVSCGEAHTLAVTDGHALYSWGGNSAGQLGHGNRDDHWSPRLVKFHVAETRGLDTGQVAQAASSRALGVSTTTIGTAEKHHHHHQHQQQQQQLHSGVGSSGGGGANEALERAVRVAARGAAAAMIKANEVCGGSPIGSAGLVALPAIAAVAAGSEHSVVLTMAGTALVFGSNASGACGPRRSDLSREEPWDAAYDCSDVLLMDTDESGGIDMDEWKVFCRSQFGEQGLVETSEEEGGGADKDAEAAREAQMEWTFNAIDTDGSGDIDRGEMLAAMKDNRIVQEWLRVCPAMSVWLTLSTGGSECFQVLHR